MKEIANYLRLAMIQAWLRGASRDETAEQFGVGNGTVSNILDKLRKSLGNYEFDSIREFVRYLRQEGMTAADCVFGSRIHRIIQKLMLQEDDIENFLTRISEFSQKMGINWDILYDGLKEIARLSNITPISEIPNYLQSLRGEIEKLQSEKRDLQEQITHLQKEKESGERDLRNLYQNAKITSNNLDYFMNTINKLESYGIPVQNIDKFVGCIEGIRNFSNYDPFKLIEKFSDLKKLEIETESKQKTKCDLEINVKNLEINIKKLEEKQSGYENILNTTIIKLKKLEELENLGFSIHDLGKIKGFLTEISSEHRVNIQQLKVLIFELLESYENRMALESENNRLLQIINILQGQIERKRNLLYCQELVGPCLKNLFSYGIDESYIVLIKAFIDVFLLSMEKDGPTLNEKREVINDLSSYSNLRLAKMNLTREIDAILNTENLENIQHHINRLNKSSSINNSENSKGKKYLVLCDSIY